MDDEGWSVGWFARLAVSVLAAAAFVAMLLAIH